MRLEDVYHQHLRCDLPLGALYLVSSARALEGIFWHKQNMPLVTEKDGPYPLLSLSAKQLGEYFKNTRQTFSIPLAIAGTPFQQQVWQQLSAIPYGETRSYKDIAAAIDNPKACRAVGTANGKNPFPIIIPCHRVIAADGTLGGFAGGLSMKEKLLSIEQQTPKIRRTH